MDIRRGKRQNKSDRWGCSHDNGDIPCQRCVLACCANDKNLTVDRWGTHLFAKEHPPLSLLRSYNAYDKRGRTFLQRNIPFCHILFIHILKCLFNSLCYRFCYIIKLFCIGKHCAVCLVGYKAALYKHSGHFGIFEHRKVWS